MERSADQAGLSLLEETGQSAEGLLSFLELLSQQEKIFTAGNNPYLRSHPLTAARITHVRDHVANSKYSHLKIKPQIQAMHDRMRGKLRIHQSSERTLQEYSPNDPNLGAQYARAIAMSKDQEVDRAVASCRRIDRRLAAGPIFP